MVKSNIPAASVVKTFSKQVFDAFDNMSKALIAPDLRERYETDIKAPAAQYSRPKNRKPELLDQIVAQMASLLPEESKSVGDYLGVRDLVTEALTCFEEAMTSEPLAERYKRFVKDVINETTAKLIEHGLDPEMMDPPQTERVPLSPADARKMAIKLFAESKDEILIKFTTTVHPTNPWTREAIIFKRNLTRQMETLAGFARNGQLIGADALGSITDSIRDFTEKVSTGLPIVHIKQVDVAQERKVGRENFAIIEEYQQDALDVHNCGIDELMAEKFLSEGESASLLLTRFPFEKLTWIDADADGRPATCAEDLARVIADCLIDNTKLDLRQNAEIHENAVSALIQQHFKNNSDFARFCGEFVENLNTLSENGRNWRSPEKSIYQQLGKHRSEFLRKILVSKHKLIPESIVAHAVPYTEMYWKKFDEFVAQERKNNPAIPEGITYKGLADYHDPLSTKYKNLQLKFRDLIRQTPVEFELDGRKAVWNFMPGKNGYHYEQQTQEGDPDYFAGSKKTYDIKDANGKVTETRWKDLEDEELDVIMDTIRRIEILHHANKKHGAGKIAERYEIANFSDASDFYALLLLLKERGVVKIEDGLVTEADIDIMPLLETLEDLEKADEIFDEILGDELALSYFQKRGKAQIMFGFSDGAKSAGNYPSEDAILKTKDMLARKFAAKGIILEIKDGRGNTVERGGILEMGLSQTGSPDILNQRSQHSQTIQSDHHVQLANSPVRGRNQMLSAIMGTITAKIAALTRTDREKQLMEVCGKATGFINTIASSRYAKLIRNNPDAVTFQKKMPFNAESSSRSQLRAVSEKSEFDKIRAVNWTQKFGTTGAPANYVGLKQALQIFISGDEVQVESLEGKTVTLSSRDLLLEMNKLAYPVADAAAIGRINHQFSAGERYEKAGVTLDVNPAIKNPLTPGQKALEVLRSHSFHGAFLRRAEGELDKNFDPIMAAAWGRKTKHEDFIGKITESVTGLADIIKQALRRFTAPNMNMANFVESLPQKERMAQQVVARAGLLAAPKASADNPAERPLWVAIKNFLMISAGNDHTPNSTARMQEIQHRYDSEGNRHVANTSGRSNSTAAPAR